MIPRLGDASIERLEVELDPEFHQSGRGHVRGIAMPGWLAIQGWAIGHDSLPVAVELSDESGEVIGEAPIEVPRQDIAEAFAGVPGASTSGFALHLRPQGSGASKLSLTVSFEDGESVPLGTLSCEVTGGDSGNGLGWEPATEARESEKVLFGKEGWLYLRRDSNNILGQQTGEVKLDPEQRQRWREVLGERMAVRDRLGTTWSCVVAADKESVYPEYLPDEITPVERRPVHEFLDLAGEVGAPVSYALDRLLASKGESELYARTDTHWNYRGAYLAYLQFCEEVARQGQELEVLREDELEWVAAEVAGDLGSKVLPEPLTGPTIRARLNQSRSRLVFDNEVTNHGRIMCFERPDPGPKCVLFGESFAYFLLPFLKETFQRLVYVHTSMFVGGVLERERPDVVFSLPLERFLVRIPSDANAYEELVATARRKGGELPWTASA